MNSRCPVTSPFPGWKFLGIKVPGDAHFQSGKKPKPLASIAGKTGQVHRVHYTGANNEQISEQRSGNVFIPKAP